MSEQRKISERASMSAEEVADSDLLSIVDVSAGEQGSKKITVFAAKQILGVPIISQTDPITDSISIEGVSYNGSPVVFEDFRFTKKYEEKPYYELGGASNNCYFIVGQWLLQHSSNASFYSDDQVDYPDEVTTWIPSNPQTTGTPVITRTVSTLANYIGHHLRSGINEYSWFIANDIAGTAVAWDSISEDSIPVILTAEDCSSVVDGGIWSTAEFDIVTEDSHNAFDISHYEVPVAGLYDISGVFAFTSVTAGNKYLMGISINATTAPNYLLGQGIAGGPGVMAIGGSVKVRLNVGDTVNMQTYCGNITTGYNATTGNCSLSIIKIED